MKSDLGKGSKKNKSKTAAHFFMDTLFIIHGSLRLLFMDLVKETGETEFDNFTVK